jgi:protein involved in polysaccharide export with SLBB domain
MNKLSFAFALGLSAALLAGCASTSKQTDYLPPVNNTASYNLTNRPTADLLQPPSSFFVLGPGDQLDVQIIGNASSHTTLTVGLDGKIYYLLLPGVDVWGLTLEQARTRLEQELGRYVNDNQMALSLKAVGSKYVWILGRVDKPGIYPLGGPMTLLEGLALAGGSARSPSAYTTQDIGDLRHSFVMRDGKSLNVNFTRLLQQGDMSQNIYLQPDDFVFIPSSLSQEIYVLGAVASPRAIAGANGPVKNAYLSHVAVVRGSLSEPRLIEVDYTDILHGRAPNLNLEPGDIVYVPLTPYHFVTDYAELIVGTFVRTWTANMGVRAVSGGSVGVNVPVGAH